MGSRHFAVPPLFAAFCVCCADARLAAAAAAPPPAKPGATAAAKLYGTWVATPTIDENVIRGMVMKDPKYKDDVEGYLKAAMKEFAELKVIYTFNGDGSGLVRRVTEARPDHRVPIRWTFDGKARIDVTILQPAEKQGETLVIRFDGDGGFTVVDFARWIPTKKPVTFRRGEAPTDTVAATASAFHGTWIATPKLSNARVRSLLGADPRYKDDLDGHAARFSKSLEGLRVVYTFEKDGTGMRRFLSARPEEASIKWAYDGKGDIRITLTKPTERPADTLSVRPDGPNRFVVIRSGGWLPVELPVAFERGEPPAVAAAGAGELPPGVPDAALAKVGTRLAEVLQKFFEDASASDSTPERPVSVSYGSVSAERIGPEGGRIVLNRVLVLPRGTSSYEEMSQLEILVTREGDTWMLSGGGTTVDVDQGVVHRSEALPPETRKSLKMAQGLKVPLAQELTAGDKPLGTAPADELKLLAARLARDVEAGMRREAALLPEMHSPNIRVISVSPTKNGASFLTMTEGEASGVVTRGGPTEFVTARADLKVTLRKSAAGKWQCFRATYQLTEVTGRQGPLMFGSGPERDLTAEVQEWLDAAPPKPTTPPAAKPARRDKA